MASNRIGRINEEIQKELAGLIRNLKDPRVADTMISITHVETTPDLRYAKVYASFLQEEKANDAIRVSNPPPAICAGSLAARFSCAILPSWFGRWTTASPTAPRC